jgi:hypothetical protein
MIARTYSRPSIAAPNAAIGAGSCQVIMRDFCAPQPSRTPPLRIGVMALLCARIGFLEAVRSYEL